MCQFFCMVDFNIGLAQKWWLKNRQTLMVNNSVANELGMATSRTSEKGELAGSWAEEEGFHHPRNSTQAGLFVVNVEAGK